jgi:hypothetical protein
MAQFPRRGRGTPKDPDEWKTVVVDESGDLHVFAWFTKRGIGELWGYKTVTIAGREYRAADYRPIGQLQS